MKIELVDKVLQRMSGILNQNQMQELKTALIISMKGANRIIHRNYR